QTYQSPQSSDITRQDDEIPQSQFPTQTRVADKAAFTSVDVDTGGGATTDIGLEASQGSGTMHKTPTRPHDSPLPRVHTLGSDDGNLKQTKQVYGAAYIKLIMKVKKLEKIVKTSHSRRRSKIVVSDDSEDSSKQGRMIEEINQDVGVTLVTPTQGEDQLEDQLGVLITAKVLVDAAKTNVHAYTRRRRAVSTSSGGISTAKELVSTTGV
ncbi:hypothetical protein Tco_1167606, partial [Tanacetum coccineum]